MNRDPILFLIDDDAIFRHNLREMFQTVRIKVLDFASAKEFLNLPAHQGPACLIIDLLMPEMDGLDLLAALKQRLIPIPVIVISAYGEISSAVRSMQLGARNFLQKPVNHQELLGLVRQAFDDYQQYSANYGNLQVMSERIKTLTHRECQVLDLIIAGKANKAIAWTLGASVRTIETHRANLLRKLEIRTVAELVRLTLPFRNELVKGSADNSSEQLIRTRSLPAFPILSHPSPSRKSPYSRANLDS